MAEPDELVFFDTNVLVYACDLGSPEKREIAIELMQKVLTGEIAGAVSNQVLSEFFVNAARKLSGRMSASDAARVVVGLEENARWKKLDYSASTARRAACSAAATGTSYWDELICQTMLENGVRTIYTENTKDFAKMRGIKAVNPFKKR